MATVVRSDSDAKLTYDVFEPNKSVRLSPLAVYRSRGHICDATRSAARTLYILEVLAKARRPLRAVEIAGPLDLSPSTASQLLKTLVDSAYLIFNPLTKRYSLSPRVGNLGMETAESYFGKSTSALLQKVMHLGLLTTTLSTSQGDYMQIVDIISSEGEFPQDNISPVDPAVGYRIPLFGSCIGAAWLSTQSENTIYSLAQLCRRELGSRLGEIHRILERIGEIRRRGYAFGGVTVDDAIRGVAVPLPPTSGGIVLVLGVSGLSSEMEARREQIARDLKAAAQWFAGQP